VQEKKRIAYYISAHGYGHGVRSCDIIRALNRLYPQFEVLIVSRLSQEFLFDRIDGARNRLRSRAFDVGMVQKDSIRVDVAATLELVEALYERSPGLAEREAAWLKEESISLVVADIPSIPLEAAAVARIPRLAVGNFGWDWIYSDFAVQDARWKRSVEIIRNSYTKTDLLLRLPFSEPMRAFPNIENIPLVASPGKSRRDEIAELLKCDPGKKWVLLSFASLELSDAALDRIEKIADYEFITVDPLRWNRRNLHAMARGQAAFTDIVASVDAVLSKPGYGILSDCAVNRKPIIYADRTDFAEYSILETSIQKYLKHLHIPAEDLYHGRLGPCLDLIWERPGASEDLSWGGDLTAARRIAAMLES
jgi:hypothetical protein